MHVDLIDITTKPFSQIPFRVNGPKVLIFSGKYDSVRVKAPFIHQRFHHGNFGRLSQNIIEGLERQARDRSWCREDNRIVHCIKDWGDLGNEKCYTVV